MRHWTAALLISVIMAGLILFAGYIFWYSNGKAVVIRQIEGLTKGKVSIGEFKIIPPFNNLLMKDIRIQGVGSIESIYISTGVIGFLTANIILDEIKITKPDFTYERFPPPEIKPANGQAAHPKVKPKKRYALRMIAKCVSVKDGKFVFIDHVAGKDGITVTFKDIDLNARSLYIFPRSIVAKFELKGSIPWRDDPIQGKITLNGWIDFFKKDMQATLGVHDIDGIYLYPYYSQYIDLEKTRIEKAKLDFNSEIQGLKNNLTADCHLELKDLVFKPRPQAEPQDREEKLAAVVLDIFKDINQGKIVLDFTLRTKMDSPVFGFGNIKTVVEGKVSEHREKKMPKIKDFLTLPTDMMKGAVKGLTDVSTSTIRGIVSVTKELKDAFLAPFRGKKEPEQAQPKQQPQQQQ